MTSMHARHAERAEPGGAAWTSTPALECRALDAGYSGNPVVHDLSLELRAGEVVALLGPNGAGKTTTLLTLVGELPAISGEVIMEGTRTKAPLHIRARKGLAYVPEERSLFRGLSCRDNLRIGQGDQEIALQLFPELRERLGVRAGLLSGGEQQMVSLGRALSARPRILIADELSLGLAPMIVTRLLEAVRQAADDGCAVLLVEQHVRQAIAVADTVHVLRRGRLELTGSAEEMSNRLSDIESYYI
jgi:branched-chain amino acid transport system ATP-binding protein